MTYFYAYGRRHESAFARQLRQERAQEKRAQTGEHPLYFTTADLVKRGWTPALIKKHLGFAQFEQRRAFGSGYYFLFRRGKVSEFLKRNPAVKAQLAVNCRKRDLRLRQVFNARWPKRHGFLVIGDFDGKRLWVDILRPRACFIAVNGNCWDDGKSLSNNVSAPA